MFIWITFTFTFTIAFWLLQLRFHFYICTFAFIFTSQMIHCTGWGGQAVQVKNSIHFSSSLLRITLHKFQQIWWKFTTNPSKVKRQSYNMIFVSNVSHSILARRVGSPDIHPSNFQNLSFSRWYSRHTWQTSFQCVPSEFMDDKRPILEQFVWYPNFLHRNEKYGLNVMK